MFALISVLLLGAGLYLGGNYMPWCFIASGLFAIAASIDSLNFTIETDGEKDSK